MTEKAQELAGEAQEKAKDAAGSARENVREQVEQRARQAGDRVSGTAGDLRSVGEELRKQGKDGPAKLADRAADQTEKVGSFLSETSPEEMLQQAEDFGRKRPWAVLAGGLVVGVATARFLKASSRSRYQQSRGPVQSQRYAIPDAAPSPQPTTPGQVPAGEPTPAIGP